MKALILAAGYATRLYPLTLDKPKPLLKVGSKTITDRLTDNISRAKEIDHIYIVTNQKFSSHFEEWARTNPRGIKASVINDRTLANETRLGAIGDMELVVRESGIKDDLLVLGGDNLFEFELGDFVAFGRRKKGAAVAVRDVGDPDEARKYGIVRVDNDEKVVEFAEKPAEPKSTLAAMCVYYFPKDTLGLLNVYLDKGLNKDAPGHYISWLSQNYRVYAYRVTGEWFDIGDKRLLELADEIYKRKDGKGVKNDKGA